MRRARKPTRTSLCKNQIEEVNNVYMTMRGWRHDYHNHMQSLKAYLAMDDISEARAYLDKLETDLDDINLLFDTGNIGVDAILNSKISLAIHNRHPGRLQGNGSERNVSDRHRLMCCDRKPDRQCGGIVRESAKRATVHPPLYRTVQGATLYFREQCH